MAETTAEDKNVLRKIRNKIVQDRYRRNHHDRKLLSGKRYREKNREKIRKWHHDHYLQYKAVKSAYSKKCVKERKLAVITHYSNGTNTCTCCGESDIRFLTLDHVNGDGNKHRRQNKIADLARWLVRNNYPEGYQILCFNCNSGRSINGGICPHKDPILSPLAEVHSLKEKAE